MENRSPIETEVELLQRAESGDTEALRQLLLGQLGDLQVFLRFQAGPRLAAKESVSDLTHSLVGDLLPELPKARFESVPAFRGWLRKAALNKIIDKTRYYGAARREAPEASSFDLQEALRSSLTPSVVAEKGEALDQLTAAMDLMPEDQREILSLVHLQGLSHSEAAEIMGRTEAASRQLLKRAMVRLTREMQELDRGA